MLRCGDSFKLTGVDLGQALHRGVRALVDPEHGVELRHLEDLEELVADVRKTELAAVDRCRRFGDLQYADDSAEPPDCPAA